MKKAHRGLLQNQTTHMKQVETLNKQGQQRCIETARGIQGTFLLQLKTTGLFPSAEEQARCSVWTQDEDTKAKSLSLGKPPRLQASHPHCTGHLG